MQLDLLDIEEFIKKHNVGRVSTVKLYQKPGSLDPTGLFSEQIFGRLGSNERRRKFGYIDLKVKIIHPEAWNIVARIDPDVSKLISATQKYTLDNTGRLIKDESGRTGVAYFCEIAKKLDYDQFNKERKEKVEFVRKNLDKILIDKFLVIPAGVRDIVYSQKSGKQNIQFSDLNMLYESIIKDANTIPDDPSTLPVDILDVITQNIQRKCLEISEWIKNRIKGKQGLIRSGMLKKISDHSGRFVITPDTSLPLGYIGLPWNAVLKLYEKFAVNYILYKDRTSNPLIRDYLQIDKKLDVRDIERLLTQINEDPESVPEQLKEYLITVAEEIIKDKQVLYKRDPVEDRDSLLAANVRVERHGYVMKLNPLDCERLGADFDGDALSVYALYTKEAQEEAKTKLNPRYAKSQWVSPRNNSNTPYLITKDAMAVIFAATKQ